MENNQNDEHRLLPYLLGYVNSNYEDINDQLFFAYDDPHAVRIVLETYSDAEFAFESRAVSETFNQEAA